MLRLLTLLAIIVALFLALPPVPAVAWSSIPFLLLAALLFDAYRRGRRLLLARKADDGMDAGADASRFLAGVILVNAVWTGLAGASAATDGVYAHGLDAGLGGGLDAGGMDSGAGDGGAGSGL